MNASSTPDAYEPDKANLPSKDGTGSSVSAVERHRSAFSHAMEEQKETPKPLHFSVVGDLDGNMPQCIALSKQAGLIGPDRNWTGWSRMAVFSGDILADSCADWFEILLFIRKLREQARAQGGDITVLAGNHEEFMLWYFAGKSVNQWRDEIQWILRGMDLGNGENKAQWMTELLAFWNARNEILENMRLDDTGRMLLEEMANMKLVELTSKTIHFHTPPNPEMLRLVCESGDVAKSVSDINRDWQCTLRTLLLWDSNSHEAKARYDTYASVFLQTANDTGESMLKRARGKASALRKYAATISSENPRDYAILIRNGIRTITYGHTDSILAVEGIRFIWTNRKSMTFNAPKPDADTPAPFPVKANATTWSSQEDAHESEARQWNEFQKILKGLQAIEFLKENIRDFRTSRYKQAFMLNAKQAEMVGEYKIGDFLSESTKWLISIKRYPQGLALRFDFSYKADDLGVSFRLPADAPKDMERLVRSVENEISQNGYENSR